MSTIRDVKKVIKELTSAIFLKKDFKKTVDKRVSLLCEFISNEIGKSFSEISAKTVLGLKSEEVFENFLSWLEEHKYFGG